MAPNENLTPVRGLIHLFKMVVLITVKSIIVYTLDRVLRMLDIKFLSPF